MSHTRLAGAVLFVCTLPVFAQQKPASATPIQQAEASIDPEKIRAHVKFLSDDLLEGRYPGLRGGSLAAAYIATQFALDGLKPAGDNGTYYQNIDFVGMKAQPGTTTMLFAPNSGTPTPLAYGDDFTVSNQTLTPTADIDAPIVFVGYGVTAPEFKWDDYAGVDVKGKVILCIVGDPPSDDPNFFGGKAMTYYGRWTYKFEQAARMGAVGALIIHRTDLASYGWDVVKNSNTSEKTYLRDDKNARLQAASWIQLEAAVKLFNAAGLDLNQEFAAAGKPGFKAVELPVHLKAHVESTVRQFQSPNVVGMVPAAKLSGPDQAMLYTAHYDHLGVKSGMPGDNIYNGAADNGTGVGMLLELARAWATIKEPLPHSVIFSAVTAEEQGLLGSQYLGQNPPIPASQIALDINYDMILPLGIPQEANVNGAQRTSFYPAVERTAKAFHLALVPDPRPEAGSYYRSDHFSLSRVGIPAFSVDAGRLYEGHDRAWGEAKFQAFEDNDYHNFTDNYRPEWDFSGLALYCRFGMDLGWQVIHEKTPITWNKGDEFEPARLASK
ncbi:Zn-dependent amino- or carboxypeptidase, M28 family [Granulicella rosea]|uniref:Zn-dependent amino- or carboxypeptidase, M28 family n=1 Tax=Granulicella rosea TaxID=474952 RepID=A0A239L721_9BACT|nr:M28 family peptidase [Granulicella rosea]SNT25708.1 Zn-dependent amino- or carboxypeptidase, M28 family [Granulicella rosea]